MGQADIRAFYFSQDFGLAITEWVKDHWRSTLKGYLEKLDRHRTYRSLSLAVIFLAVGIFLKLTHELQEDVELSAFDKSVLEGIVKLRQDAILGPVIDITALGSIAVSVVVCTVGVVVLLMARKRRAALQFILAGFGAAFWTTLIKNIAERSRPEEAYRLIEASGHSFPSGHSFAAAAIYFSVAILAMRQFSSYRHRAVLFLMATVISLLVGVSRVYLGAHYPSDVASGLSLGLAWALILEAFLGPKTPSVES